MDETMDENLRWALEMQATTARSRNTLMMLDIVDDDRKKLHSNKNDVRPETAMLIDCSSLRGRGCEGRLKYVLQPHTLPHPPPHQGNFLQVESETSKTTGKIKHHHHTILSLWLQFFLNI